ncbi:MAG: pyrroline-5-carboxylate reductase [Candidatus Omnitrophica bacterium]|nr:pyrroline-5-carboxylate reductase [Candidatus Omnitrophota bacterium]MBU1923800.1 pyrroline-5-carboxylate reductase [Candidatus Omnitrophota bacterium]
MRDVKKRLGIIGFGNMGSSIAFGARSLFEVSVFDKDKQKLVKQANNRGLKTEMLATDLINSSDVIILAVKPQDFDILLNEIKPFIQGKLILSIAAGITTGYIEMILKEARVVRAMPNIAVKISAAETSLAKGKYAKEEDLNFAKELFGLLGKVWVVKEEMIDSATAISGSGPAYIFYDMEINKLDSSKIKIERKNEYIQRLKQAALDVGFGPKMALDLAINTIASSIQLLVQTGSSPMELRKMITSAGGTTEAALEVLSRNGSWSEAALAAKKRAQELSRKE